MVNGAPAGIRLLISSSGFLPCAAMELRQAELTLTMYLLITGRPDGLPGLNPDGMYILGSVLDGPSDGNG